MAVYVVDASVVMEYLVTGSFTDNARALFAQVSASDRLIVPEFCLLECTNVLWKQVRFQGMGVSQAQTLLRHLRRLPLLRVPVKAALPMALSISLQQRLPVYDSVHVALASRLGCPLVSLDQPQTRAAAATDVLLKSLSDFVL